MRRSGSFNVIGYILSLEGSVIHFVSNLFRIFGSVDCMNAEGSNKNDILLISIVVFVRF